jgi:hypothetical protein
MSCPGWDKDYHNTGASVDGLLHGPCSSHVYRAAGLAGIVFRRCSTSDPYPSLQSSQSGPCTASAWPICDVFSAASSAYPRRDEADLIDAHMHASTCASMHTHMRTRVHTCMHMDACVYAYTCTCAHTYTRSPTHRHRRRHRCRNRQAGRQAGRQIDTHTHTLAHACTHVHMHKLAHMHTYTQVKYMLYIYIYVFVYIYIYVCSHNSHNSHTCTVAHMGTQAHENPHTHTLALALALAMTEHVGAQVAYHDVGRTIAHQNWLLAAVLTPGDITDSRSSQIVCFSPLLEPWPVRGEYICGSVRFCGVIWSSSRLLPYTCLVVDMAICLVTMRKTYTRDVAQ